MYLEPMERWRPVPGFANYEVSDEGRVRSIDHVTMRRDGKKLTRKGQIIKPRLLRRYWCVCLHRGDKDYTRSVHSLVALAFIGPRPAGKQVLHEDDDRDNNVVGNLRYGTNAENSRDAVRNGVHPESKVTKCPAGHEYTPENTYMKRNMRGGYGRICRACGRIKAAERKKRSRA
ncbi:HNH endonuclease [Gordonia phage DalanDe]|nr:HNH endonuclease [Gordonia phage DalanDe]